MNQWLENINECIQDNHVSLKVSFEVFLDFSFIRNKAFIELNKGNSFALDGNYETRYTVEAKDLFIDNDIKINSLEFEEEKQQEGFYCINIYATYQIPKDFKVELGSRGNASISHIAQKIFDRFQIMLAMCNKLAILIPSTLNMYIDQKGTWKKVTQIGGGHPQISPFPPDETQELIKEISKVSKKIDDALKIKKNKKIIDLYYSGLRFKSNNFIEDAFLNFYKIIEVTFKSKEFATKYTKALEKPSNYIDIISQCSQKVQMLFIWEYLKKSSSNYDEKFLTNLLEVAEIRNKLAHAGHKEISPENMLLVQNLALLFVRHIVLGQEI